MDLEKQLQCVSKLISIDEDREVYTQYYDIVRKFIMDKLCEDPFFQALYRGTELFGSYADSVKIEKPDEFDVYVLFDFHQFGAKVSKSALPSAARVSLIDWIHTSKSHQFYSNILSLVDEKSGYLIPSKINSWFQGVIARQNLSSPMSLKIGKDYFRMSYSTSGFAQTLKVNVGNIYFAIDLVPSIELLCNKVWISDRKYVKFQGDQSYWNIAPKPHKKDKFAFKTSFTKMETFMMNDKNQMKNVLRLIKKFQTRNQMNLKSYFIKTIFLWIDEERGSDFWKQSNLLILTEILKRMLSIFKSGSLLCFWDKSENMISGMKERRRYNIIITLTRCIQSLENCDNIYQMFFNKRQMRKLKKQFVF